MHDADEGAGFIGTLGDLGPCLTFAQRLEVEWEANRLDVPDFTHAGFRRVQFGTDDGGEIICSIRTRIRNREAVDLHEVIGHDQEVIALPAIGLAHVSRRKAAVRIGAMGVDVSLEEGTGTAEIEIVHGRPRMQEQISA
jgi:hypothetical protein